MPYKKTVADNECLNCWVCCAYTVIAVRTARGGSPSARRQLRVGWFLTSEKTLVKTTCRKNRKRSPSPNVFGSKGVIPFADSIRMLFMPERKLFVLLCSVINSRLSTSFFSSRTTRNSPCSSNTSLLSSSLSPLASLP